MATLKQRMNRKNAAGEYDTVHLETDSDMVLMSDGTTRLSNKLTAIDSSITSISRTIGIGDALTDVPTTVGAKYQFGGRSWTIVHVLNHLVYAITTDIVRTMAFGLTNVYADSALFEKCYDFQYTLTPAEVAVLAPVSVGGMTSKVFIPSSNRFNGGFSYFNSNERRIAKYNGTAQPYWTSTPIGSSGVWIVRADGSLYDGSGVPSYAYGFRPCVAFRR